MKNILVKILAYSSVVLAAMVIQGCAQQTWRPGPGLTLADFEPTKAECSLAARNSGSSFTAYGNQNFVAGASLGHAIGESIKAQANFNDCMTARGWKVTTPQDAASMAQRKQTFQTAVSQLKACVARVRRTPQFAPLLPYAPDPDTGGHSMAQLTIDHLATPEEAKLLAEFFDQTEPCVKEATAEYEKVSPELAAVARQARVDAIAAALKVAKKQQTWSTYFQESDSRQTALKAKLSRINL